jgi:hypothetical protein
MKVRSSFKIASGSIIVALTAIVLITSSSSSGENSKRSLTVRQGQEITLGDSLKIVIGRIGDGEAEITVSQNNAISTSLGAQRDKEPTPKNPSCPCECTPVEKPRNCKNNPDCD